VLVIDPDPQRWVRTTSALNRAGYTSLEVRDPQDAVGHLDAHEADLILLHLPAGPDGAGQLTDFLQSFSPSEYIPLIVMANYVDEDIRCTYLDAGADDVISEWTSQDELVARVRALLRIKGLHNQLSASRLALQRALRRERRLLEKLRRDNAHLYTLATTDPLTHTQNARSFRDILEHEFKASRRYEHELSLIMVDVDHFKVINDTHGHPSGDYVLKELAVILKGSVRDSDVVARVGGEEFAILLPRADRKQARKFAERIRKEVASHRFVVHGAEIHVTISLGLACFPNDPEIADASMLVYFSDQALLIAKESGRNRCVVVGEVDPNRRQRLRRQFFDAPYSSGAVNVDWPDDVPGDPVEADPPGNPTESSPFPSS